MAKAPIANAPSASAPRVAAPIAERPMASWGILAGFVMGNLALSSSEIGRKGQETNAISRYNKTARGNVYTQFCSWSFCSCDLSLKWWARLGNSGGLQAVRPRPGPSHPLVSHRTERKLSQEDMISYGFSVRHWQMIEAGRPSTLFTLLRICEAFGIQPEQLVAGLFRKRKKE